VLSGSCKNLFFSPLQELLVHNAKFTKKPDVFAAGIIFLELIALCSPATLYKVLWPRILSVSLPPSLKQILKMSLEPNPELRSGSFEDKLMILKSDDGNNIGEISKDAGLSFDISSEVEQYLPSALVGAT
jgi:hypothetical protein